MRVLVVADFAEFYNRRNLYGAGIYAKKEGWTLIQHQVTTREALQGALQNVDALLLGTHSLESDVLLTRSPLPATGWSASLADVTWPRVLTDDLGVGRKAADHFLSLALKHFAFYSDATGIWVDRRREGFIARVETAGYKVHLTTPEMALEPIWTPQMVMEWVRSLPTPIGIMVGHDPAAAAVMSACKILNRQVPEDVAIVGVNDDDRFVNLVTPPLSTVTHRYEQIGYEAAELLARVAGRTGRVPWLILVPPGELIQRQSSDVLGSSDTLVGEAVRYIRDHLADGVQTKQVVAHTRVCRATLNSKFVATIGRTVSAEIRRARLEQCRHLLSSTTLPMPEIAKRTGFSSARQLSETFHREVGMTMTQYRQQNKTIGV